MDKRASIAAWAEALLAYSQAIVLQYVLKPDSTPQPEATSLTLNCAAEHHYETTRSQLKTVVVSYRGLVPLQNTLT